jgi:hypothetical protein
MRATLGLLLVGTFALAGCDAILGISDHTLAAGSDSGAHDSGIGPRNDGGSSSGSGSGSSSGTGSGSGASSGTGSGSGHCSQPGATPCVLGTPPGLGSCCVE